MPDLEQLYDLGWHDKAANEEFLQLLVERSIYLSEYPRDNAQLRRWREDEEFAESEGYEIFVRSCLS